MFICGPLLDSLLLTEESCKVVLELSVMAVHALFAGAVRCGFRV